MHNGRLDLLLRQFEKTIRKQLDDSKDEVWLYDNFFIEGKAYKIKVIVEEYDSNE